MFDLTGQTALVTGAATGIGEAIAKRLTAAGARVAVADIDMEAANAAARRIGNGAFAVCLDVSRTEQANAAVDKVIATAGSLEILVNNAGLAGRAAPIWDQTDDDWHRVMSVNIHGPFYLCRAVLPKMRSKGYGRIVNVASIAGKEGNPNMAAYSASKAAIIGLTKAIAKEAPPKASASTPLLRPSSAPRFSTSSRRRRWSTWCRRFPCAEQAMRKKSPPWCTSSPAATARLSPASATT